MGATPAGERAACMYPVLYHARRKFPKEGLGVMMVEVDELLKAIHAACLECVGGNAARVVLCDRFECPLWRFRNWEAVEGVELTRHMEALLAESERLKGVIEQLEARKAFAEFIQLLKAKVLVDSQIRQLQREAVATRLRLVDCGTAATMDADSGKGWRAGSAGDGRTCQDSRGCPAASGPDAPRTGERAEWRRRDG